MITVTILTPENSWFRSHALDLCGLLSQHGFSSTLSTSMEDAQPGDVCFLLSWDQMVDADFRSLFTQCCVVHASALPEGRGWSPWVWSIIGGAESIALTLFEAAEQVDSGRVYARSEVPLTGTELLPEIREKLAAGINGLCLMFLQRRQELTEESVEQSGEPTYHPRRTSEDSRMDPEASIASQFDLLRVVDNDRYPAFFDYRGRRYVLRITAVDE